MPRDKKTSKKKKDRGRSRSRSRKHDKKKPTKKRKNETSSSSAQSSNSSRSSVSSSFDKKEKNATLEASHKLLKQLRKALFKDPDAFQLQELLLKHVESGGVDAAAGDKKANKKKAKKKKKQTTKLTPDALRQLLLSTVDSHASSASSRKRSKDSSSSSDEISEDPAEMTNSKSRTSSSVFSDLLRHEDVAFATETLPVLLDYCEFRSSSRQNRETTATGYQLAPLLREAAELYRGSLAAILVQYGADVLRLPANLRERVPSLGKPDNKRSSYARPNDERKPWLSTAQNNAKPWLSTAQNNAISDWARAWAAFDAACHDDDEEDETTGARTSARSTSYFDSFYSSQSAAGGGPNNFNNSWVDDILEQRQRKKQKHLESEAEARERQRDAALNSHQTRQDRMYKNLTEQQKQETRNVKAPTGPRPPPTYYPGFSREEYRPAGASHQDAEDLPYDRPAGPEPRPNSGLPPAREFTPAGPSQPTKTRAERAKDGLAEDERRWSSFVQGQGIAEKNRITYSDIPWPRGLQDFENKSKRAMDLDWLSLTSKQERKVLLLRWHPDKFLARVKPFVRDPREFDRVTDKCKQVMQTLNDLNAAGAGPQR
ncbi:unnamed protein product [Amoebophrya sp. A120]|nr:unnamed protein product [Amoebophrya sp. A120]|eukprot:GSA120T00001648001.1